MLRDGVPVEYPRPDGTIAGDHVRLVDFGDVRANDWLAVNQFTVIEGQHNRRPDIVVFVNGLPLGLIELKNAADEDATIWSAYAQLQTYKAEIPSLLHYNAALVVSDGLQARIGSLTANQEWFKVWRTSTAIDGEHDAAQDRAGTGGADPRGVRAAAVPGPAPAFHRLRGRPGLRARCTRSSPATTSSTR